MEHSNLPLWVQTTDRSPWKKMESHLHLEHQRVQSGSVGMETRNHTGISSVAKRLSTSTLIAPPNSVVFVISGNCISLLRFMSCPSNVSSWSVGFATNFGVSAPSDSLSLSFEPGNGKFLSLSFSLGLSLSFLFGVRAGGVACVWRARVGLNCDDGNALRGGLSTIDSAITCLSVTTTTTHLPLSRAWGCSIFVPWLVFEWGGIVVSESLESLVCPLCVVVCSTGLVVQSYLVVLAASPASPSYL